MFAAAHSLRGRRWGVPFVGPTVYTNALSTGAATWRRVGDCQTPNARGESSWCATATFAEVPICRPSFNAAFQTLQQHRLALSEMIALFRRSLFH